MIAIPNMEKPKSCWECFNADCNHWGEHGYDNTAGCPLIEIDLEKDIPTIWYNRQTRRYEPKGTKQEVYERLYKLKNGERRG